MASNIPMQAATQFHQFTKLPLELQFRIWHESIKQTPPRVYELYDHYPLMNWDIGDDDYEDEPEIPVGADARDIRSLFERPITPEIKDITLYERSTVLQRPLLQVDRTSRMENIRHYRIVKFLNAHVYMNMDVDIIYLGKFQTEWLDDCFLLKTYMDPFWQTVKCLAFGLEHFLSWLLVETPGSFDGEPFSESVLEESIEMLISQFPALETFILVLDDVWKRSDRREPKVNGAITFGDPRWVTAGQLKEYHREWMMFLHEKWKISTSLEIASISRSGRVQYPCWDLDAGRILPEWLHSIMGLWNRASADQDTSESDMEGDDSERLVSSEDSDSQGETQEPENKDSV